MSEAPRRRFALIDAMGLVMAVAIGLVLAKDWVRRVQWVWVGKPFGLWIIQARTAVAFVVIPLAFATLLLATRRPRPARIGLGLATCVALVARAVVGTIGYAPYLIRTTVPPGTHVANWQNETFGPYGQAHVVRSAWIALAVSRCWRPEPTWPDRMGRAIGAFAIVSEIFIWLHYLAVG